MNRNDVTEKIITVKVSKGIKCADKIQAFVAAVRAADLSLSSPS